MIYEEIKNNINKLFCYYEQPDGGIPAICTFFLNQSRFKQYKDIVSMFYMKYLTHMHENTQVLWFNIKLRQLKYIIQNKYLYFISILIYPDVI